MTARRKSGRPRNSSEAGKSKKMMPFSLGMTFEAIRWRLGLDQGEMRDRLCNIPCEFILPKSHKDDPSNPGQTVSNWERARNNVPFAVQFRYSVIADSYSGILHLISLLYANARDFSIREATDEEKQRILIENKELADRLKRLSEFILALTNQLQDGTIVNKLHGDPDKDESVRTEHLRLIAEMIDAAKLALAPANNPRS